MKKRQIIRLITDRKITPKKPLGNTKCETDNGVITICYGRRRKWLSANDAIKFFLNSILCSDGYEKRKIRENR